MKNTITFLLICIPLFLHAQQGVVATGGDAEGPGGTMSSSTGLTDFYVIESEQFSLQFGLQQTHMDIEVPPDTFAVYVKVVLEGAFSPGEGYCDAYSPSSVYTPQPALRTRFALFWQSFAPMVL